MDDNFKYFPLSSEGREILRRYDEIIQALRSEVAALQEEYGNKIEAAHVKARTEMHPMWCQMAAMTGIDADTSWDSQEWGIEARYLKDGFGALTHLTQPVHPFQAAMAASEEAEVEELDEEGPPPGATVN